MDKSNFLVIIDTSEVRGKLPSAILNVFVIRATDALNAKSILFKLVGPVAEAQIRTAVYVYGIDEIGANLKIIDESSKDLPLFSFMPLAGGRPQRQDDALLKPRIDNGNKTLESNAINNPVTNTQIQQKVDPRNFVTNARSEEFQRREEGRPNTTNNLTRDQQELVNRLGVSSQTGNEGQNLRVNNSTGRNVNISRQSVDQSVPDTLDLDKARLLQSVGVNVNLNEQVIRDAELEHEIAQMRGAPNFEDTSLTAIDNKILTEADIAQMKNELKGLE